MGALYRHRGPALLPGCLCSTPTSWLGGFGHPPLWVSPTLLSAGSAFATKGRQWTALQRYLAGLSNILKPLSQPSAEIIYWSWIDVFCFAVKTLFFFESLSPLCISEMCICPEVRIYSPAPKHYTSRKSTNFPVTLYKQLFLLGKEKRWFPLKSKNINHGKRSRGQSHHPFFFKFLWYKSRLTSGCFQRNCARFAATAFWLVVGTTSCFTHIIRILN